MRRWHQFFAPVFAFFLMAIAITGVLTKAVSVLDHVPARVQTLGGAPAKVLACAEKPARPKRTPLGEFGHTVKAIHSGESFGFVGTVLTIASGLALTFFAGSGFWMYLQMYLRRRRMGAGR